MTNSTSAAKRIRGDNFGEKFFHPTGAVWARRWKSTDALQDKSNDDDDDRELSEAQLRYDLAVAHRRLARYGMDMLTWNDISHRFGNGCLITPARPDVNAILPVHTPAATAISCLEEGFIPYTQDAAYFYNKTVRYEWDGLSNKVEEGPLLQAAVKSNPYCNVMLMDHHGFTCFGKSVKEVWILAYYFERACEVQCRIVGSGGTPKLPPESVIREAAETSYLPQFALESRNGMPCALPCHLETNRKWSVCMAKAA